MVDWRVLVFAQIPAHPRDAFSPHDVVGIDHRFQPGMAATCPPTTITEFGDNSRTMRHISRTLPTLTMIEEMPTMS